MALNCTSSSILLCVLYYYDSDSDQQQNDFVFGTAKLVGVLVVSEVEARVVVLAPPAVERMIHIQSGICSFSPTNYRLPIQGKCYLVAAHVRRRRCHLNPRVAPWWFPLTILAQSSPSTWGTTIISTLLLLSTG